MKLSWFAAHTPDKRMVQPKQRLQLIEEKQYYVACMVCHPERKQTVYGMLPLSKKEMDEILGLDKRLNNGDTTVRELRKQFFERHKHKLEQFLGPMDAHGLGDVVDMNHAAIPAGF